MSFLINKNKLAITHTFAIKLKENVNENHNHRKEKKNLKIVIFFSKFGKKSPKFHWEWGLISAPVNAKKNLGFHSLP